MSARVCALALALAGCSQHGALVEGVMASAYRPAVVDAHLKRFKLLAGDLHCHVAPPDDPGDVSRDLTETLKLARDERLDFVVLTPHVAARFFADPAAREAVSESQRELRAAIDALDARDVTLIPGFEYTDHRFGHAGASFADLDAVLADVPLEVARANPERFFERWVARGGMLVINHPLVTPLDSIFRMARADLSWRPLTKRGPYPPEIAAIDRLAQGWEAFNLTASHLRDRYLLGDSDHTIVATMRRMDVVSREGRRRIAPVGGSDSHGMHLRVTTFVLAESRAPEAIRDAIVAGRTCVRDGAACSLEARAPGHAPAVVGEALDGVASVEVSARGKDIEVIEDSRVVATPASGQWVKLDVPASCSLIRARVDEGFSAPIYVNCGLR